MSQNGMGRECRHFDLHTTSSACVRKVDISKKEENETERGRSKGGRDNLRKKGSETVVISKTG